MPRPRPPLLHQGARYLPISPYISLLFFIKVRDAQRCHGEGSSSSGGSSSSAWGSAWGAAPGGAPRARRRGTPSSCLLRTTTYYDLLRPTTTYYDLLQPTTTHHASGSPLTAQPYPYPYPYPYHASGPPLTAQAGRPLAPHLEQEGVSSGGDQRGPSQPRGGFPVAPLQSQRAEPEGTVSVGAAGCVWGATTSSQAHVPYSTLG